MKKSIIFVILFISCVCSFTVTISVDPTEKYQKITGFGCHLNNLDSAAKIYYQDEQFITDYIDDMGNNIVRFELHPNFLTDELHIDKIENYKNYKSDLSNDNVNNIFKSLKKLSVKSDNLKVIGTVWSPPAWMKNNKKNAGGELDKKYYTHFAAYLYQYYVFMKEQYDVSIYAISIQNELRHYKPYNSCVYRKEQYRDIMKVVGKYFKEKKCPVFFLGTEDMITNSDQIISYIDTIMSDKESGHYLEFIATHGYLNGVISNGGSFTDNLNLYNTLKKYNKSFWMTETSGESWKWNDDSVFYENGEPVPGALNGLAVKIHTALVYGFASSWIYWTITDKESPTIYSMCSGYDDWRYIVQKHYSYFIKSDSIRIYSAPDDINNVLSSAFYYEKDNSIVSIIINLSNEAQNVNLKFPDGLSPDTISRYESNGIDKLKKFIHNKPSFKISPSSINTLTFNLSKTDKHLETVFPEISCDKESCSTNTSLLVNLSIKRGFGYFSTDEGKTYQKFNCLYDKGEKRILLTDSTKLMYYAEDDGIKSPIITRIYNINTGKQNDVYIMKKALLIESENYNDITESKNETTWKKMIGPDGSLVMQSYTANTNRKDIKFSSTLFYKVNFITKGDYYIWVRGCNSSTFKNLSSINMKIDTSNPELLNFPLAYENSVDLYDTYLHWEKRKITIDEPGIHTISLTTMTDSCMVDKLIISDDFDTNFFPVNYIPIPATPQKITVKKSTFDKIYLEWQSCENATGYKIYYCLNNGDFDSYHYMNVKNHNTVFDKLYLANRNPEGFLHANTTYNFRISAISPQGESTYSEIVTVNTASGGNGGTLNFVNAKIAGFPIYNSGVFYSQGYIWRWNKCSAEYTSLGSLINTFKRGVVFYGDKSEISSEKIPGGVGNISFNISNHNKLTGAEFAVYINGNQVAKTEKLSIDNGFFKYIIPGINISGDVIITIKNLTSENNQSSCGSIADFSWTGYIKSAPESPDEISCNFLEGKNVLKWNKVNDAISYRIYRGESNAYWRLIAEVDDMLQYEDTNYGKPGKYIITSVNMNAESKPGKK